MSRVSVFPRCWREVARDIGNETSRHRVLELSEELNRALGIELYRELNRAPDRQERRLAVRAITSAKSVGRVLEFRMAKP